MILLKLFSCVRTGASFVVSGDTFGLCLTTCDSFNLVALVLSILKL